MEKAAIPFCEQETIINIVPAQVGNRINIYSCIPADVRYYRKLVADNPGDVIMIREDGYGIEIEIPFSWLRRPKPPKRMSDDQRAAAALRLQLARERRCEA